jgi:hypothetical protein
MTSEAEMHPRYQPSRIVTAAIIATGVALVGYASWAQEAVKPNSNQGKPAKMAPVDNNPFKQGGTSQGRATTPVNTAIDGKKAEGGKAGFTSPATPITDAKKAGGGKAGFTSSAQTITDPKKAAGGKAGFTSPAQAGASASHTTTPGKKF